MRAHPTEGLFPFGYRQTAITGTAAGLPDDDNLRKCRVVLISFTAAGGGVRLRWDGTAPDSSTGVLLYHGDERVFTQAEAERLSMILDAAAASATWHAHYYRIV